MSGLRFKVGELAIIVVDAHGNGLEGAMVEIVEIGPFGFKDGSISDYHISPPCGGSSLVGDERWYCQDYELRKIDPPAEPEAMTRQTEQECEA